MGFRDLVGSVEGVRSELGVVVGCTLERVVVTVVPQPQPLPEGNIPQLQQQWYPFCSTQPGTIGWSGTGEELHCHAKVPQEAKTVPPPIVEVVEGRVVEAGAILVVGAAEREEVGLKDWPAAREGLEVDLTVGVAGVDVLEGRMVMSAQFQKPSG